MAKIQLKSDNINPFGGLFSIFNQFDSSGLRTVIGGRVKGLDRTARLKCFLRTFVIVPAKRIKSGRSLGIGHA